jgi:hypothetical protein
MEWWAHRILLSPVATSGRLGKIQDQFYTITKQYKNKSQAGLLHFVLNSKKFTSKKTETPG